jgi:hypothetical protein
MSYIPDATDITNPTDTGIQAATAAAEFRAIKVLLATKAAIVGATLVTPVLGTPVSGTLTNCAGLPYAGVSINSGYLLGRQTAGYGAAEQITIGTGLSLAAGVMIATGGLGDMVLATAQTVNGAKTFNPNMLLIKGSSTGYTSFASANASASNYIITFPASTGTVFTDAGIIPADHGGTGIANNVASTLTITGAYSLGLTISGATALTLPTAGTLAILGANTFTADQTHGNTNIKTVKTITFNAEYDNGNSATAVTITLANAQKQKLTLTGNATVTISTTGAAIGSYQLRLIQDATGGRTVTWSGLSASRWLGSLTAPAINSAIAGESLITMFFDGTNITQSAAKIGTS